MCLMIQNRIFLEENQLFSEEKRSLMLNSDKSTCSSERDKKCWCCFVYNFSSHTYLQGSSAGTTKAKTKRKKSLRNVQFHLNNKFMLSPRTLSFNSKVKSIPLSFFRLRHQLVPHRIDSSKVAWPVVDHPHSESMTAHCQHHVHSYKLWNALLKVLFAVSFSFRQTTGTCGKIVRSQQAGSRNVFKFQFYSSFALCIAGNTGLLDGIRRHLFFLSLSLFRTIFRQSRVLSLEKSNWSKFPVALVGELIVAHWNFALFVRHYYYVEQVQLHSIFYFQVAFSPTVALTVLVPLNYIVVVRPRLLTVKVFRKNFEIIVGGGAVGWLCKS